MQRRNDALARCSSCSSSTSSSASSPPVDESFAWVEQLGISIGAAIEIDTLLACTTLLLVVILQLLSSPVGAHAHSRASRRQTPAALDGPDHLTRDEAEGEHG